MKIQTKNKLMLLIVIMFPFVTTGCVKYNEELKIHGTKSMNIYVTFAVNQSIVDYKFDDEKIDQLKSKGYSVKEYKSDKYKGIELKYKIRNIDKVSTNKDTTYSLTSIRNEVPDKMFKIKKSWFKNYYKANFTFDSTDIEPITVSDESLDSIEYLCDDGSVITVNQGEEIKEGCHRAYDYEIKNAKSKKPLKSEELTDKINQDNDLKFIVKLNKKAISNDADKTKHNKELTWNLKTNGITNINFEFSLYNYFHIFITLLIIVIIASGIVLLIKRIKRSKKRKKK
ncbi:MAG: hypothetical protein IKE63_05930 [Bacilli bacterium]|nr:hypothetical protein [Bacilli bacterium]